MFPEVLFSIVVLLPVFVTSHYYQKVDKSNECDCYCSEFLSSKITRDLSLCQKLARFEKEFLSIKMEMEKRTQHVWELQSLKRKLDFQEDRISNLEEEIKSFKKEKIEGLPTPEALYMKPDEVMMRDSNGDTHFKEDDKELVKNVSSLFAKVEEVESLTTKVQEELKSERRVRRHLEEDLNQTRSSIKILDDKLHNVTSPMDSRVTHVEEVVFSTLENMNRTFFEDHIQKLYYKVDGVVYKNETKKLDERLDLMETELHEVSNNISTKEFTDEMESLAMTIRSLNQTFTEKLASEEIRLDAMETKAIVLEQQMKEEIHEVSLKLKQDFVDETTILADNLHIFNKTLKDIEQHETRLGAMENKTRKLTELEDMNDHLEILLNVTELMQGGMSQMWSDILNSRNKSANLEKELDYQVIQLSNIIAVVRQLENLSSEIDSLKSNASKSDSLVLNLQKEIKILAADIAVAENHIHDLTVESETKVQDIQWRIDNLTETMDGSLSAIVTHFISQKNTKAEHTEIPEDSDNTEDKGDESYDRLRISGEETIPCSLPTLKDTQLLVSMDEDSDEQQLEFGCRSIGRYVLEKPSVPLKCVDGTWKGPLPSCKKLLEKKEISALERDLERKNPCLLGSGEFPDPTNCSYFFKCWHGNSDRLPCPKMLVFDKVTKRCDYPRVAKCQPHSTEETDTLLNLIPTINVEPDMIDKPYGLMGTSDAGDLIVYPGMHFSLNCLYPENRWGPATWHVDLFLPSSSVKEIKTKNAGNTVSLTVTASSREDSGTYICRSPFGKQNSITVIVQAVTCPAVDLGSGSSFLDVTYRPHPDGAYRILTTPVVFMCRDGTSITAYCEANGRWSRQLPTAEECQPKRPINATIWGCPFINTEDNQDLLLERNDQDKTITFKCAGNNNLIGNTYTRCYNGAWTHDTLPRCIPRRY